MSEVTKETLTNAYKPYDVVTNKGGDVGFIQEVSVNECQDDPIHQISYAVNWLVGSETKHAWFSHDDLFLHCNLFIKIAESSCHPMSGSSYSVKSLFSNFK